MTTKLAVGEAAIGCWQLCRLSGVYLGKWLLPAGRLDSNPR